MSLSRCVTLSAISTGSAACRGSAGETVAVIGRLREREACCVASATSCPVQSFPGRLGKLAAALLACNWTGSDGLLTSLAFLIIQCATTCRRRSKVLASSKGSLQDENP